MQLEILELQSNMRQMIPGSQNTSSSFPMPNELVDTISQFYKCDFEDLFFDLLGTELSVEGLVYFFKNSIPKLIRCIQGYFESAEDRLREVACIGDLEGPIMNVLRKSYQNNWKEIFKRCLSEEDVNGITREIQATLRIGEASCSTNEVLNAFFMRFSEILFCLHINDPPFRCMDQFIGQRVEFNSLLHDAIDGFIRTGDNCFIILPQILKSTGESVLRAGVLRTDYELS